MPPISSSLHGDNSNDLREAIQLSVVIPVFNESGNVGPLHREILHILEKNYSSNFEIIFVDDYSSDNTLEELNKLKPVKIISLQRHYGQSCALDAGIKNAKGALIITMDGDGQNDPAAIPELISKLNEGYDVVCGWRQKRKDSLIKCFLAGGANFLRRLILADKIHDAGCTLRIYRRECWQNLNLYGEMHRMIPALLKYHGFNITEIPINHRPRLHGRTKYDFRRVLNGFSDMVYIGFLQKYSNRPMHLFSRLSILFVSGGIFLLFIKPWGGILLILIGLQFLYNGIMTTHLLQTSKSTTYVIREIRELVS